MPRACALHDRGMFTVQIEARRAWPSFERFLPPAPERDPSKGGRPRIPDAVIFTWICWYCRSGCPWKLSPPGCPWRTCQRRLRQWREAGVFERWARSLTEAAGPPHGPCFIDATFIRARTAGEEIGLTRHGRGSVLQVICDWRSRPVTWACTAAGPGEARRAMNLIDTLKPVPILIGDRAYRAGYLHAKLAEQGTRSYAPLLSNDRKAQRV